MESRKKDRYQSQIFYTTKASKRSVRCIVTHTHTHTCNHTAVLRLSFGISFRNHLLDKIFRPFLCLGKKASNSSERERVTPWGFRDVLINVVVFIFKAIKTRIPFKRDKHQHWAIIEWNEWMFGEGVRETITTPNLY